MNRHPTQPPLLLLISVHSSRMTSYGTHSCPHTPTVSDIWTRFKVTGAPDYLGSHVVGQLVVQEYKVEG